MLGTRSASVKAVSPLSIHGMAFSDITLEYEDGSSDQARLGPEALPPGLAPGDKVIAHMAMSVIVSITRPGTA